MTTDKTHENDAGGEQRAERATEIAYEIGEDERPSEAVVRATSAVTNTSVIELDPLYETVDPDHLDGLFGGSIDRTIGEDASVTFSYSGCRVSVDGETVTVRPE